MIIQIAEYQGTRHRCEGEKRDKDSTCNGGEADGVCVGRKVGCWEEVAEGLNHVSEREHPECGVFEEGPG